MTDKKSPAEPDYSNPNPDAYDPDDWRNYSDDDDPQEPSTPPGPDYADGAVPPGTEEFYARLGKIAGRDVAVPDFAPVPQRRVRLSGWTAERQRVFIATLADTGLVSEAAHEAGMTRQGAYKLRRAPGAEAFARAWDMAIAQAARQLTDIAFERAISGVREPVFDRNGNIAGMKCKLNDRLLMFLLRFHRRDVYGTGREPIIRQADRAEIDRANQGHSPVPGAMDALEDSDVPLDENDYAGFALPHADGEEGPGEGDPAEDADAADTVGEFPTGKP